MVDDLEVVDISQNVHEPAIPVLLEPRGTKGARFWRDTVDDDADEQPWVPGRDQYPMPESVDERKADVALEQIACVLYLLHAAPHDIVGDPLLQIAGLRCDFVLALHQLKDESDLVHHDDAIGEHHILGGVGGKLGCREGERSQECVFILLSGELL